MRFDRKIGGAEELTLALTECDYEYLDSVLLKVFENKILDGDDNLKGWATDFRRTVMAGKNLLTNHSIMEEMIPEGFNPLHE